jgi:hypothetical protein
MNPTAITIGVHAHQRASLQEFIDAEALPWTLVDAPGGRLNLAEAAQPAECSLDRLVPGGRILCSVALEMAEACHAPTGAIGRLMNLLEIKIRECQLGCFR